MLDKDVERVKKKSLRVVSESRRSIAEMSSRTCMSHLFVSVRTLFIAGVVWKDRPKDEDMTEGALKMVRLAEGFYKDDFCPIDPRYNIIF